MNIPLIRRFGLPLVLMAAAAVLLAGCNDSSPTEPKAAAATPTPTQTPTPLPPGGSIAGMWTGTYVSTDFIECDTSIVFPAQATLSQNGSDVGGTLTATGDPNSNGCACGNVTFTGTLHGKFLLGTVVSPSFPGFPGSTWTVSGSLSGSTLNITLLNAYGNVFGQMHLHR